MNNGFTSPTKFKRAQWESAIKRWPLVTSARKVAFTYLGLRPVSEMDELEFSQWKAERLCQIGKDKHVHPANASLKMFSIHFFLSGPENVYVYKDYLQEHGNATFKMLQPKKQYKDSINYGLYCDFIVRNNGILLAIAVDETHNDSTGTIELAVLSLKDNGHNGYDLYPISIESDHLVFTDIDALQSIGVWLGHLFDGIQYEMIFKPEHVSIRHEKIKKEAMDDEVKRNGNKTRVVKVRRVISIDLNETENDAVANRNGISEEGVERIRHPYTLPCWGVCGHYRHYKSGKVVWIHPYKKGKDRDKEGVYCGKQYQFVKEDSQG